MTMEIESKQNKEATGIINPKSYDSDTPSVLTQAGGKTPVRISGVGGTEIGSGNDAEYLRNGLFGIFGGAQAEVQQTGVGKFGRATGDIKVDGISWRHLAYEVGVSTNWTNYGFDKTDSEEEQNYKWYAGEAQANNLEAYELLEQNPEPSTIISDEDYERVNLLRKSLMTHIADANEGVLDKNMAQLTAVQLMSKPTLLAAAQKRRWYELARNSNVGAVMRATWADEYSRTQLLKNNKIPGIDVSPRVDTSYWGMTKNAMHQTFSGMGMGESNAGILGVKNFNSGQNLEMKRTQGDIDAYIANKDISPDLAVRIQEDFEENGGASAISLAEDVQAGHDTVAIEKANADSLVKTMFHGAAPYLVNPLSYAGGASGVKVAGTIAWSKLTSPVLQKTLQSVSTGGLVGLGESLGHTSLNYKDFTNEELLTTWATDAGMGAAFSFAFSAAASGLSKRGAAAKERAAGEGIQDLEITGLDIPFSS